jgi:hypothetical protein
VRRIRPGTQRVREGTCAAHPEVAVGLRDLQDTTAILTFAFEEAGRRGATLVAVHSWNGLPAASWRPGDPAQLAAEADRNLAEALGPWRDKYPAVPVRQDVVRDHPARALVCDSTRADLVVLGRHGTPRSLPPRARRPAAWQGRISPGQMS